MFRFIAVAVLLAAPLASSASAVELQTNFHYGEHVGFPPMEVPTSIYGGWGTQGWKCQNINQVPVQPGLPPMFPTGCNPGGCNYCDSVWAGYQQKAFHKRINRRWYYGNHRPMPPGPAMPFVQSDGQPIGGQQVIVEGNQVDGNGTVIRPEEVPQRPAYDAPSHSDPAHDDSPRRDDPPVPQTTERPFRSILKRSAAT